MEKMKRVAIVLSLSLVLPYFQLVFEAKPAHASLADKQAEGLVSTQNSLNKDLNTFYSGLTSYPGYMHTSSISVFGPDAFAVVLDKGVSPIIGASRYGGGRVIAAGNESYFNLKSSPETTEGIIASNLLQWLTEDKSPNPVTGNSNRYSNALKGSEKLKLVKKDTPDALLIAQNLPIEQVLVESWSNLDPREYPVAFAEVMYVTKEEAEILDQYVRSGGSLIIANKGWIMSMHPKPHISNQAKDRNQVKVTDYPAQRLLNHAGLAIVDDCKYTTDPNPKPTLDQIHNANLSNLTDAFMQVESKAKNFMDYAAVSEKQPMDVWKRMNAAAAVIKAIVADDPYVVKVKSDIEAAMAGLTFPLDRLAKPYTSFLIQYKSAVTTLDDLGVKFTPSDVFPGKVDSSAPFVEKTIPVNMEFGNFDYLRIRNTPGHWVSTGTYAPAGSIVTVDVPADESDLDVQIGAHTDDLAPTDVSKWDRLPVVSLKKRLNPGLNKISSPYGGLVYIIPTKSKTGRMVNVKVGGVVQAPYFVLGQTSEQQWNDIIRNHPAPWAELQSNHIILTVPSEDIRSLNNPKQLMEKWDEIYGLYTNLAGLHSDNSSPHKSPDWPYRYAEDIQIRNGGMHAGYPIMVKTWYYSKDLVNFDSIQHKGWGFWHELGHNFQMNSWTWDGNIEVTNNLYSLYVQEYFGGISEASKSYPKAAQFVANPDKNKNYQDLTDGRLVMFAQLKYAYGWDFYTKLHAAYRNLEESRLPKNTQENMDLFVIQSSKIAGENLLEFYDKWGVKYSKQAKDAVTALNLPKPSLLIWQLGDPAKPHLVPRKQMSAAATSEETVFQNNAASMAIDGDTNTLWHTKWKNGKPLPQSITLKLGGNYNVNSIHYMPRQWGGTNGNITDYRVLVSSDGENFKEVASGKWTNDNIKKTVEFSPIKTSYVRLVAIAGAQGHAAAAEIEVFYSLAGGK